MYADEEEWLDDRWDRLYRDCRDELYRGACLLVGAHDAEEVVQEAFERAMREPHFFERVQNPVGWLRVVGARQALTRLRRAQRWLAIQAFLRPTQPPDADLDLERALTRLTAPQRAAVVLRYYHGLDYTEIASALDVAPASVGPLLTRARTALRAMLR
jgi:RNA polymerase sigma-70 factor (ECF subfamily)